ALDSARRLSRAHRRPGGRPARACGLHRMGECSGLAGTGAALRTLGRRTADRHASDRGLRQRRCAARAGNGIRNTVALEPSLARPMTPSAEKLSEALAGARLHGAVLDAREFAAALDDAKQAYEVQDDVLARTGELPSGVPLFWKSGGP